MKLLVVVALVAAVASAAPQQRPERQLSQGQEIQLLRYDTENDGNGHYSFGYEQTDGHKHQESGELRNAGADNEFTAVKGAYEWVGPDGVRYVVTYIADDNGFQPTIEQGPGGAVPGAVVASLLG